MFLFNDKDKPRKTRRWGIKNTIQTFVAVSG